MSLYHKMRLLFRASAEAPMRQLVANNDIVIFEQEIAEAEKAIKSAKLHLAQIKTEAKLTELSTLELKENIAKREQQALEVLGKDQELAEELAGLIAEDEKLLEAEFTNLTQLKKLDSKITSDIKSAIRIIQSHRHKLGFLKANQHSLHASNSIKSYTTGIHSKVNDLNSSLDGINKRQLRVRLADESESDIENSLGSLDIAARLKAVGVSSNDGTEQVMQRLLKKKAGAN